MRAINPKTRCTNCKENNLSPEGREWCLDWCLKAWDALEEVISEPAVYQEMRKSPHRHTWGREANRIECLDDGKLYQSARVLSELLDVSESAVCNCCRGRYITLKGKQYRYIGDTSRKWITPKVKPRKAVPRSRKSTPVLDKMTGVTYESCGKCAAALMCGKATIYKHLTRQDDDPMKRFVYAPPVSEES